MEEQQQKTSCKRCELREMQKIAPIPGTIIRFYRDHLNKMTLKKLLFILKFIFIVTFSYLASYVHFNRMVVIPFYQRFLENIVFAMCYFIVRPKLQVVPQIICCANLLCCLTTMDWSPKVYVFLQAICFGVCDSFRWYGLTVASIHVMFSCLLTGYKEVERAWCLGMLMSAMLAVAIIQQLPLGFEEACCIFVIYCSCTYAEDKYMTENLALAILFATIAWTVCKYLRLKRGYVLVQPKTPFLLEEIQDCLESELVGSSEEL